MAGITPEMAFLQSMQAEQTSSNAAIPSAGSDSDEAEDDSGSEDGSSDDAEDADEEDEEDEEQEEGDEEEDDYDPSALVTPNDASTGNPNGANASASSIKARTKGGFVVDDSDEEDDAPTPAGAVGAQVIGRADASRSITGTPLNGPATNDVQISKSEDVESPAKRSALNLAASSVPLTGAVPSPAVPSVTLTASSASEATRSKAAAPTKMRLPTDTVGLLEDRIADDERGDIDAWLELISEYRSKNKYDEARKVYERYFQLFPTAADQWVEYAKMELDIEEFFKVENIFSRSLMTIPSVQLWSMYLNYIRRRNNLINDPDGRARQTVTQAYEFVLNNIGIDKDAGPIWKDYIQFLKSGPGTPGGASWQDQQKMDLLRKGYRQAIVVPTPELESIWREYYTFETQLNAQTGRKFLMEMTPAMLAAKQALVPIQNITRNINRSTTPKLPPLPGFDGDTEYDEQVDIWKRWLHWEREDHLELRDDDLATYKKRVLFLYKQATISMRFEPFFWADAADFCFAHGLDSEGTSFLENGIQANPESALLAYKLGDRLESIGAKENGQDALKRRGDQVREPYSKLLDNLYSLMKVNQVREEKTVARIQENFANQMAQSPLSDVDEEEQQTKQKAMQDVQDAQIRGVQAGAKAQNDLLKKMVSLTWVALMRAMRRIQGKGKIGDPVGGMRAIFNEARKRGQLTSDVYVASALLEHHCYKDPAATKIFERGIRLFPEDENFALEYLKHLIDINDLTNARAVFETAVNKLTQKPETAGRSLQLYLFFHNFESNYGELSQVTKLETRMRELFPADIKDIFAQRFQNVAPRITMFDPTSARPVISMQAQARPKALPSIEAHRPLSPIPPTNNSPAPFSPRPTNAHLAVQDVAPRLSPKRPHQPDVSTIMEAEPPRKLARGESPFKGAAGRRINAAKAANTATPPLPRDVNIFLSILPTREQSTNLPIKIPSNTMMAILRIVKLSQPQNGAGQSAGMQRGGSAQGQPVPQQYGYMQR